MAKMKSECEHLWSHTHPATEITNQGQKYGSSSQPFFDPFSCLSGPRSSLMKLVLILRTRLSNAAIRNAQKDSYSEVIFG